MAENVRDNVQRTGIEVVATAPKPTRRNLANDGRQAAQIAPVPRGTNFGFFATQKDYDATTKAVSGGQKINSWKGRVGEQHKKWHEMAVTREATIGAEHHCVLQHRLNTVVADEYASVLDKSRAGSEQGLHQ
jgi:hypothetical protein